MSRQSRFLAPAAAALMLAAPVAHARPAIDPPTHNSAPPLGATATPARPSADDFDWGSAAIGAGGTIAGLIVLVSAGAVSIRSRSVSTR